MNDPKISDDSKGALKKKKEMLEKEKQKLNERIKYIEDWIRRLVNPRNDTKKLMEELKKKVKEWLKEDGV